LSNTRTGFALMPDFNAGHEQLAQQQTSWQFPYVLLATQAGGGSSNEGLLTAKLLLSNGTKTQLAPQITAYAVSQGRVQELPLALPTLGPLETRLSDLSQLLQQLPAGVSRIALTVSHAGQPGDLGLSIFSVNTSGQVVARSEGLILPMDNPFISYWDISSGRSLFHWIKNVTGGISAAARATMYYQGVDGLRSYQIPATLTAESTAKPFDLTVLLHSGIPDDRGNRLPVGIASGLVVMEPMDIAPSTVASHLPICSSNCSSQELQDVPRIALSSPVVFEQRSVSLTCPAGPTVSISGPSTMALTGLIALIATGTPSGGTYSWSVSDPSVIILSSTTGPTVSVSASSAGTSDVTVKYTEGSGTEGGAIATATQTIVVQGCPTTLTRLNSFAEPLAPLVPAELTGVGIIAEMQVGPTTVDWGFTPITESVTTTSNSCPASFGSCTGNSTFSVGASDAGYSSVDTVPTPATTNVFWDNHNTNSPMNLLNAAGITSCTQICSQTYSCGGKLLGPTYTITRSFTQGKVGSNAVTNVTVTKTP